MATQLTHKGRRVLVAGAGGIGSAVATGFLEAGADVVLLDIHEGALERVAEGADASASLMTHPVDMSQPEQVVRAVHQAEEHLGGLEVAVHCVGINRRHALVEMDLEVWNHVIAVNLTSAFTFCRTAADVLVKSGGGSILAMSSVSGLLAHKHHGPYAASKGGLNQLLRVLAHEVAADGVNVNAIAPGYIETDLTSEYLSRPNMRESLESMVPMGRLGTPDELVGPALFLTSELASFITGQVVYVDGGRTLI